MSEGLEMSARRMLYRRIERRGEVGLLRSMAETEYTPKAEGHQLVESLKASGLIESQTRGGWGGLSRAPEILVATRAGAGKDGGRW